MYNLPRMNHEETDQLNRQITSKDGVTVTKNFPKNKSLGLADFNGEFYKTLKEDLNLKITHCGPGTIMSHWSMKYRRPNLTQTLNEIKLLFRGNPEDHVVF